MSETPKTFRELLPAAIAVENLLIEAGGELTPEIEQALVLKDQTLPEKIDNLGFRIERLESFETYIKSKVDAYTKLLKGAQNATEYLKNYIKTEMLVNNTPEVSGSDFKFKVSKTTGQVVIEDESKLDGAYIITETITKVDKKKIKEDLALGVPVTGARLEENYSLRKSIPRGGK